MANAIVKKVKGQGKRSVVRPRVASLVWTLKSIAEFEKRASGVTITYPTTTSNRCNNESSSSSKRVTGVTVMDNIMTILVYIQKEQRNQRREDVRTLRTCRWVVQLHWLKLSKINLMLDERCSGMCLIKAIALVKKLNIQKIHLVQTW